MKKKLYFHIGTHKTGTTTIQNILYNNRNLLEYKFDLKYAETGLVHNLGKHGEFFKYANEKDAFYNLLLSLKKEILKTYSNSILISDESLFKVFYKKNNIDSIKEILNDIDIYFIVFIRRQDELLESLLNQRVKSNRIFYDAFDIEDFIQKNKHYVDYTVTLNNLIKTFSKDKIIIFDFKEVKNSLADKFFSIYNINYKELKIEREIYNARIDNKYVPLKLLLNDRSLNKERNHSYNIAINKLKTNDKYHLFNYMQTTALLQTCSECNHRIVNEWPNVFSDYIVMTPLKDEFKNVVSWKSKRIVKVLFKLELEIILTIRTIKRKIRRVMDIKELIRLKKRG